MTALSTCANIVGKRSWCYSVSALCCLRMALPTYAPNGTLEHPFWRSSQFLGFLHWLQSFFLKFLNFPWRFLPTTPHSALSSAYRMLTYGDILPALLYVTYAVAVLVTVGAVIALHVLALFRIVVMIFDDLQQRRTLDRETLEECRYSLGFLFVSAGCLIFGPLAFLIICALVFILSWRHKSHTQ
jgi:hypothetical protein